MYACQITSGLKMVKNHTRLLLRMGAVTLVSGSVQDQVKCQKIEDTRIIFFTVLFCQTND